MRYSIIFSKSFIHDFFTIFLLVQFSYMDPMVGFFWPDLTVYTPNSNPVFPVIHSKRPWSASPPTPSYLELPSAALHPLPNQSVTSKPVKRMRTNDQSMTKSRTHYIMSELKDYMPKCNILCNAARRDIRHIMLTDEPYPSSKQGLTMAQTAYDKAQNKSPEIKPEICAFSISIILVSSSTLKLNG